MWRDVFLHNKEAVLEMLGRFTEDLTALQRAIRYGDGDTLFNHFTETRKIRRDIIDAGQDTAEPDFGRHVADVDQATDSQPEMDCLDGTECRLEEGQALRMPALRGGLT